MFKSIFENKISEKLNNFNNSGKQAIEWMDKFRQSLDITEKIQEKINNTINIDQSFNNFNNNNAAAAAAEGGGGGGGVGGTATTSSSNASSFDKGGSSAYENETKTSKGMNSRQTSFKQKELQSASQSSSTKQQASSSSNSSSFRSKTLLTRDPSVDSQEEMAAYFNSSGSNQHQQQQHHHQQKDESSLPDNFNNSTSSTNEKKMRNTLTVNDHAASAETDQSQLSSSSSLSQKSDQSSQSQNYSSVNTNSNVNNNKSYQLQQSRSIADEQHHHSPSRVLVRQSTDLTTSFPLKSFQKINSETVEIPGLNVKVVRYRIENDLGRIDPHLYTKYSMNGVDANSQLTKGKLYFTLHYNNEIQSFSVTINRAEIFHSGQQSNSTVGSTSLAPSGSSTPSSPNLNKPDTYVKVLLLPDKKKKYMTRIQRKTFTPVYEETFYFQMPFQELQTKTLCLTHLEFGRFSKHELIGSIRMNDLHTIKDLASADVDFVRNLVHLAEDDLELGELTMTLCYLPAAGRLTVTIVKAINLKAMDINGKSDPYVKVTLVSRGKRLKKKKTSVMKNTLNPVYNESMLFDIPQDQIEQVDMVVKVIDYDRVGSNELIGCIGVGPSFNGIGRDHWYRMIENPRKPVSQSYYLRDGNFLREGLPATIEKALNAGRQESMESKNSESYS